MSASDIPRRPTAVRPQLRPLTVESVYGALAAGWADFRAAPQFGLFFGGVYAVAGIFLFLQVWAWDRLVWIFPLALAFPLVGPFVAIGCYEVSRRREQGQPLDWSRILSVVWRERNRQMPGMAFIVLAGMVVWLWAAGILVALFLGRMQAAVYSDVDALLATGPGLALLVVGTLVGGAIAAALFSVTAVSLPLLMERDIDVVTAMVTSARVVRDNPGPMLAWAWIVAASLFAAMLPLFLGLVVVLPVLGHATWHLYRLAIAPEG